MLKVPLLLLPSVPFALFNAKKLAAPTVAAPEPTFSIVPLLTSVAVVPLPNELATFAENRISPLLV